MAHAVFEDHFDYRSQGLSPEELEELIDSDSNEIETVGATVIEVRDEEIVFEASREQLVALWGADDVDFALDNYDANPHPYTGTTCDECVRQEAAR